MDAGMIPGFVSVGAGDWRRMVFGDEIVSDSRKATLKEKGD